MHAITESAAFPPGISAWLRRMHRRDERIVSIHNLIFGLDRWRYLFYRTRNLINVTFLRLMVHFAEFSLAVYTLPHAMYGLMIFRLLSLAVEGSWWGTTDAMRHRIRLLHNQQDTPGIVHEITGWVTLTCVLSGIIIAAFAGAAALIALQYHDNTLALLTVVIGIQTAARILSRTFYSGAFALSRVFIPFQLVMGIELLVLCGGALIHHLLGTYTVVLCLLVSTMAIAAISYLYVRRVTDLLRVTPARVFSIKSLRYAMRHHRFPALLWPSLASFGMRVHDTLLIILLHYLAPREPIAQTLLFPVYLAMPLLRNSMTWAQVLYFDLSKYHLDLFAGFRRSIETMGLRFSFLLSSFFGACALVLGALFDVAALVPIEKVLMPYMFVTGTYGFILISLFSRRAYKAVLALCSVQYFMLWLLVIKNPCQSPIEIGLILSLLVPLMAGWAYMKMPWYAPVEAISPYHIWAWWLHQQVKPMTVTTLQFHPAATELTQRRTLIHIANQLPRTAKIGSLNGALHIATVDAPPTEEMLMRAAGGHATKIFSTTRIEPRAEPLATAKLAEQFLEQFPTGMVQYPMQKNPTLAAFTNEDRRAWLFDARMPVQDTRRRRARGWFVTTACEGRFITAIFLVRRSDTTPAQCAAWLVHLRDQ